MVSIMHLHANQQRCDNRILALQRSIHHSSSRLHSCSHSHQYERTAILYTCEWGPYLGTASTGSIGLHVRAPGPCDLSQLSIAKNKHPEQELPIEFIGLVIFCAVICTEQLLQLCFLQLVLLLLRSL